ncbi:hypothetical protein BGZ61DRAFT_445638 [Ilyonectria robusta]|uniref:uncharacterized protein n=1 Tax=Ilyonectria robusta TaxID=1079257 RepID=UPI001E8DADA5|nr:uncharacterized protein BGZ61DRAFT_445638 [Ilyonectria robusta]KAH8733979.1 hypothetical protein BGZ61DRAFT_445638 [Ilyonectria robusta]
MSPPTGRRDKNAVQPSKRERGRVAQREYRKRHNSKFQSLQEENQRLKDAIQKISTVASTSGRREQELKDAISEAVSIAGVQTVDQSPVEEVGSSQDGEPTSLVALPLTRETLPEPWLPPNQSETGGNSLLQDFHTPPILSQQLWLDTDRLVRIYDTPSDIVPYLGDGLLTVAGCLYWACTYHAVSLWRKIKNPQEPNLSDQGRLDRMFNHSKYLNDHNFLMSIAQARLDFRNQGYIERLHEQDYPADKEAMAEVCKLVLHEYAEKKEDLQWWRNPREVESYIKQHLTTDELAQLQELVEGRGSTKAVRAFSSLFDTLAQNFVCFGNEPRWNVVHISMTLGAWLGNRSDWWGSS